MIVRVVTLQATGVVIDLDGHKVGAPRGRCSGGW